jgi:hypothetical protein
MSSVKLSIVDWSVQLNTNLTGARIAAHTHAQPGNGIFFPFRKQEGLRLISTEVS